MFYYLFLHKEKNQFSGHVDKNMGFVYEKYVIPTPLTFNLFKLI